MFTGIIQTLGTVKTVRQAGNASAIAVDIGSLAGQCKPGDSIDVNGVCLTVSSLKGSIATFDVSGETLQKTTIGGLAVNKMVNLEPAIGPGDRFGGHFVLGHVDGTGKIKEIRRQGEFAVIKFSAGRELLGQMVSKGSVAVDGISLTIAGLETESFTVAVIPQTLERTNLAVARPGTPVNIETDVIVKTIKRQLENLLPASGLTLERLKEIGF